jgi:hypothetical protein
MGLRCENQALTNQYHLKLSEVQYKMLPKCHIGIYWVFNPLLGSPLSILAPIA